jgi:hypothetical protein
LSSHSSSIDRQDAAAKAKDTIVIDVEVFASNAVSVQATTPVAEMKIDEGPKMDEARASLLASYASPLNTGVHR